MMLLKCMTNKAEVLQERHKKRDKHNMVVFFILTLSINSSNAGQN